MTQEIRNTNLARYANLNRKERNMYNASLKNRWDSKNILDTAVEEAQILAEGRGVAKGRYENALETAREMKNDGEPTSKILKFTKLSIEEIDAL